MTISELKRTMDFVKKCIMDAGALGRFNDLISILEQNSRVQPHTGQQQQPITTQKAALISVIRAINIQELTLNERQLLKTFIDPNLMGEKGAAKINQIFADHNLDPMGAVNAFKEV